MTTLFSDFFFVISCPTIQFVLSTNILMAGKLESERALNANLAGILRTVENGRVGTKRADRRLNSGTVVRGGRPERPPPPLRTRKMEENANVGIAERAKRTVRRHFTFPALFLTNGP